MGDDPPATPTRAAVLRKLDAPLSLEEVTLSAPAAGEVRVAVRGVGVCHTDVSAIAGTMPRPLPTVLGHEGAGIVEAVGAGVTSLAPGDPVVMSFDHCGACRWCTEHRPAYCEQFTARNYLGARMDGSLTLSRDGEPIHGSWLGQSSFAAHALATEHNAVKVDTELPVELLGALGCGLLTGAGAVLNVLRPRPGESIAVFGLGSVGLAALMAAKASGCDPIVGVDPNGARRELAASLGATHTIDPDAVPSVGRAIRGIAREGLACSVDAVGAGPVIHTALRVLRSPGTCVTLGFRGNHHDITIDQGHLLFGRALIGVIEGDAEPQTFIPRLLALQARGEFPVRATPHDVPVHRHQFGDRGAARRERDQAGAAVLAAGAENGSPSRADRLSGGRPPRGPGGPRASY